MTSCISSCLSDLTTDMSASADASPAAKSPTTVAVEMPITLGQFLKVADFASTGGEAKHLIVSGLVTVNGQAELHRGHQLKPGDIVATLGGRPVAVALGPDRT
jgi:ribosome-associated protein